MHDLLKWLSLVRWLVKVVVHFFPLSSLSLCKWDLCGLWKEPQCQGREWKVPRSTILWNFIENLINQSNQSNLFNHVTPGSSHRLAIEHFQKRKGLRVNTKPFQQFLAHKPVNFPCKLILSFNHVQDYWKFKADKHKVLSLPGPNNYQDYRKKIRRGINAEWNRK